MISIPLISIILDSILSNCIIISTDFFSPLFTLTSLIILYPFIHDDNKYIKILIISGLLYDSLTNTLLISTIIFLIIYYFIKIITTYLSNNTINNLLILIISIIIYRSVFYIILVISPYYEFNSLILFKSIYSSFAINIIYAVILSIILKKLKIKSY